jgi:hypothetical protein
VNRSGEVAGISNGQSFVAAGLRRSLTAAKSSASFQRAVSMSMDDNPYRAPNDVSITVEPEDEVNKLNWLVPFAALWIVLLFLGLPAINFSSRLNPPGTFLWLKLITTPISAGSGIVLATIPKRRWLCVTVPAILLVVVLQYTTWVRFP